MGTALQQSPRHNQRVVVLQPNQSPSGQEETEDAEAREVESPVVVDLGVHEVTTAESPQELHRSVACLIAGRCAYV